MPVKPIPAGYHTVTPYLIVNGAAKAIDFYKKAFGAEEKFRMAGPDGRIGHAELQIGDSPIMLADEHPGMNCKSPTSYGGTPVSIMLYVENSDAMTKQAEAAGARIDRPIQTQFYGDRSASITDPFGHMWMISTHVEDVPEEELKKRAAEMMKKMAGEKK